jgi:uncharacterized protein YjdB
VGGSRVTVPDEELVLTLSVERDTLVPGASRLLVARVTNKAGAPRLAPVAWSSSNPEVASVAGGAVTAVGTGEALIIARSGGVSDTATIIVPAVELQLTPSAVLASAGDTVRFRAAFVGAGIDADAPGVDWSVSDTNLAQVRGSLLVARSEGDVQLTAVTAGFIARAAVRIKAARIASLTIIPAVASVSVGGSVDFDVVARDERGRIVAAPDLEWFTSDPAIATISERGRARALARGGVVIGARANGRVATAVLNISSEPASGLLLQLPALQIAVGQRIQATATPLDASGNPLPGRPVAWQSSNPAVATVNSQGLISGIAAGTTTISAVSDGRVASQALTVVVPSPSRVVVIPEMARLTRGSRTKLAAEVRDQLGNVLPSASVSWSSMNPTVATVSSAGEVTAVGEGTALVRASSAGLADTAVVSVEGIPVASVAVSPAAVTLFPGQQQSASAVALDASGNQLSDRPVSWTSSNPEIATVSNNGLITAIAIGSAFVTANIEGKSASVSVTVNAPPPLPAATVLVTLATNSVTVGQSVQAFARVLDAQGNELSGRPVSWSSANPTVATVNANGVVTAVSAGSATIVAQREGVQGFAVLNVEPPPQSPVASIELSAPRTDLAVGDSVALGVTLRDAAGNVLLGRTVAFSSSLQSVATVSVNGVVTGRGEGNATITATSEGVSRSLGINVRWPVGSVSVTLGASTLLPGQGTQAEALVLSPSGTALSGRAVSWSSSNTAVATVNASGYVTAVAAGSAQIIATSEGKSGSATLTVQVPPAPVATVSVTLSASTLLPGQGTQATVVLRDASGNVLTGRAVSWSSSNTAVATVNASGYVTAVAAGSAQIIATSEGKSGSAALTVQEPAPPPPPPPSGVVAPAAPRLIDFPYPQVTGVTRVVNAGQDLQAVLNQAQRGDEIVLQAGATWTGNFVLPAKSAGSGWIIIRSSRASELAPGVRVTPAVANLMPKLRTPNTDPALRTAPGARGWYIVGLEIELDPSFNQYANYGIVRFEGGVGRLVLDRVYVHGGTSTPTQRCVAVNSDSTVVMNSYLAECHGKGYDSQAIAAWDGPGPFKIVNNTLMGAGENVMFGGAGSSSDATRPRDVEFRRNYVYKPASWKGVWTVKNLFELKNVERILVEGNVFDGSWLDAQVGFAFVFMSEDETSWSGTTDVTVRYNVIRNAGAGINIWPHAGSRPVREPVSRVLIEHNIVENINQGIYTGDGKLFQILGDSDPAYTANDIQLRNNTMTGNNGTAVVVTQYGPRNFVLVNNVFTRGTYGFFRDGGLAFAGAFSGSVTLSPNVIIPDSGGSSWPSGTLFASSLATVPSGYGANTAQVQAATSGVVIP